MTYIAVVIVVENNKTELNNKALEYASIQFWLIWL